MLSKILIDLLMNPHFLPMKLVISRSSKHIEIYYHFISDLARNKHLQVSYIPIADMVADRMTKPLQCITFMRFNNQISIVSGGVGESSVMMDKS
jgi:hypothetical protein